MERKMSIAVDMDDVLACTSEKIMATYNELYQGNYTTEDLLGIEIEDFLSKEVIIELYQEFNKPGFTRDLCLKPDALEVMSRLNEQYDVYIASAAMEVPGTFFDKYDWLKEHFPFLSPQHFIFCGNKKVVRADYLIDDNIRQLRNFRGRGILFSSHMNHGRPCEFVRLDSWADISTYFLDHYEERLVETAQEQDGTRSEEFF